MTDGDNCQRNHYASSVAALVGIKIIEKYHYLL